MKFQVSSHQDNFLLDLGTTSSIELNQADYPENDVCEDETMLGQVMPCAGPDVKIEVCKASSGFILSVVRGKYNP